jgi:hypothetical protein
MRERWLEPVLERELAPVTAPEELWDRVQLPRARRCRHPLHRQGAWALAAAALVLAVWGLRTSRQLEFHSTDAVRIQSWVKVNSGLDVELPARPPRSIQLLGAHVIRGANPAVEVTYRAGNHDARLLVLKADESLANPPAHEVLGNGLRNGASVFSWSMHGQQYTLACATPGDLQAACLLCHT